MRLCSSGYTLLVNAEVDSMGGVVDRRGGIGIGTNLSPQIAVIEETRAELRQHYVSYEEARRELEFLEKGGDPLDFRPGSADPLSVQSTSLTNQHAEQFVTCEAKGSSFALAASPPGDSAESGGRGPRAPPAYELNSADNLMLFDGERNSIHSDRNNIGPSEPSFQLDRSQNAKGSSDSAAFGIPRKAYRRRNRSRPSRDGARSSSTDLVPAHGGLVSVTSDSNSKPTSPDCSMAAKVEASDSRLNLELDGVQTVESSVELVNSGSFDAKTGDNAFNNLDDNQHNELLEPDARRTSIHMATWKPVSLGEREEEVVLAGEKCVPSLATEKLEERVTSSQMNGFVNAKGDKEVTLNERQNGQNSQNSNVVLGAKGLDSESSCTQPSLSIDGNIDIEICTNLGNGCSNGITEEEAVMFEEAPSMEGDKSVKENSESKAGDIMCDVNNVDTESIHKSHQENGSILKYEKALRDKVSGSESEVKDPIATEDMELVGCTASENDRNVPSNLLGSNNTHEKENTCIGRLEGSIDSPIREIPGTMLSAGVTTVSPEQQNCSQVKTELEKKVHEDSILEEARIIEAKRKRIAELSVRTLPLGNHGKSHWGFVLGEMKWLANDFAQERLWKICAAPQIGRQAAAAARLKFHEWNTRLKQKEVCHNLAKGVMDFWSLVEKTSKEQQMQKPGKDFAHAGVEGYALRFLKNNNSSSIVQYVQAEAPTTPDRISDSGISDISWDVNLTEENLFYSVPSGAMEVYRKYIESHLLQCQKTGCNMVEEVEISGFDSLAGIGSQENAFEEEEGYFEGSKASKNAQKKRKHSIKAYEGRSSYEMGGSDSSFMQCHEDKVEKRPANNTLNVSIPTKRVRTASRQRVIGPFNAAGNSGCGVQAPNKADAASSGDTNSFQDDLSSLHGGSSKPNGLEVESAQDLGKQQPFDSAEISHKPKKRKKATNLGSSYEQGWQVDSNFQNEQRNNFKRRFESHQLESNGGSGLYGQHIMKKPKMMKQSLDNSVDILTPRGGSVPSPVASQMSNMSNPNKFMKMFGGRDRGRKAKALKTPAGQPGSGSTWSLFEEQALVVLVHDMGPNWELVSDAINSTLQFKCIFRKPEECKERHKALMDSPAGDGADSAEDSGSSQPYRSTLPGIPKGSARQLFQRLQGPMEEDTIKSHLEKIIVIGKKLHHKRTQNGNQDPKQLQLPHNSHTLALSQVCPNNLNGGPVLTPLDLCDAPASGPDVLSLGYQSPHSGGLPSVAPMIPPPGVNPSVQSSPNMVLGSSFSSPSAPVNASVRDGRFGIPRSASLSTDEQQRLQQYNQMLSGRNIQQSNGPVVPGVVHPGSDHGGVRMLSGGLNRSVPMPLPMARPGGGLQGIGSPSSMLNSGSMISSSGMVAAMPNHPVNIHPGGPTVQGNSMIRPRDALHMMRPTVHNAEHQRQMMVVPGGGFSPSPPNQASMPPVQSYTPLHHPMSAQQQSHVLSNSQQAYAIRLAKERHIQQQCLLQQHQQFAASSNNALLPPQAQGQPQLPPVSSSSPRNTSPPAASSISPLMSSSPMMTPMLQHPQKQPYGVGRTPQVGGGLTNNQMGKQQRQRNPQERQQARVLKGGGRGNNMMMMMQQQNLPSMDHHHPILNGQGGALYSGGPPGLINSVQPPTHKQSVSPQQNLYLSSQAIPHPSHSDNSSNQSHGQPVIAGGPTLSAASVQAVPPPAVMPQPHLKLVSQSQATVKKLKRQASTGHLPNKRQAREAQPDDRHHPVNNLSQKGSIPPVPVSADEATANNVTPVITSASPPPQWKASSEPVAYDDSNHEPQQLVGPIGSPPPSTNSSTSGPTLNR